MTKYLAIFLGLAFYAQVSLSDDVLLTGEDLLTKYSSQFAITVAITVIEGTLNAKIDTFCLKQARPNATIYIVNKAECSVEINRQLDQFKDVTELTNHLLELRVFKSKYKL